MFDTSTLEKRTGHSVCRLRNNVVWTDSVWSGSVRYGQNPSILSPRRSQPEEQTKRCVTGEDIRHQKQPNKPFGMRELVSSLPERHNKKSCANFSPRHSLHRTPKGICHQHKTDNIWDRSQGNRGSGGKGEEGSEHNRTHTQNTNTNTNPTQYPLSNTRTNYRPAR